VTDHRVPGCLPVGSCVGMVQDFIISHCPCNTSARQCCDGLQAADGGVGARSFMSTTGDGTVAADCQQSEFSVSSDVNTLNG